MHKKILLVIVAAALLVTALWIAGCAPKAEPAAGPTHQMPNGETMPGMNMGGAPATPPATPAPPTAPAAPTAASPQHPATAHPAPKPAAAVIYTCPMHPEVQQDHPGKCPICGMNLVKKS
jgi:hypothetical protein